MVLKEIFAAGREEMCRARLLLLAVFFFFHSASAWPGGGQHYPNGAEGFLCGLVPGPGIYLLSYSSFYHADELKDHHGKGVKALDLDLTVMAEALRITVFPGIKLFGADYGFYVAPVIYSADITVEGRGLKLADDRFSGMGDMVFSPFMLGWHLNKNLHGLLSLDIMAPTGHYNPGHPATTILSRNHWTFEPTAAMTLLMGPGIDLSFKAMLDINSSNNDYLDQFGNQHTLRPGTEFHMDFALGIPLSEGIRIGLLGYVYQQLAHDRLDSRTLEDDKGFVWALGPGLRVSGERFGLIVKGYQEISARNRPRGYGLWLKLQGRF